MNIKETIPSLYKSDTLSLCAWIWLEAITKTQDEILEGGKPISIMEGAKMFQEFFGMEEDDLGIYNIRQCYYRMQAKNRKRMRKEVLGAFDHHDPDLKLILQNIEKQLIELNEQTCRQK